MQPEKQLTRMWANAQRDGRPVEYRWRPLFNATKFGWRPLLECCAVTRARRKPVETSGPKFAILWGHVEEILPFNNKFFFRLLMHALVAKIQPDKVVRWCPDGEYLHHFCMLYFQRAACNTLQTCILNLHQGHTMCRSMADIHSATAEIRREKKKKAEEETTRQKRNVRIYYAGRP